MLTGSQGLSDTEEGAVQRFRKADKHCNNHDRTGAGDGTPDVPGIVRTLVEASKNTAGKGQQSAVVQLTLQGHSVSQG